jgi:PhnB protein
MKNLNSLIRFNGNTEQVFDFYKSVFGGEFSAVMRWKDMPDKEFCEKMSDADKEKIMHISLPVGIGNVLMGCDVLESMGQNHSAGDNFFLSISAESKAEADRFFVALGQNGQILMPRENTFWGSYFGMLTDQFGIKWMIGFDG